LERANAERAAKQQAEEQAAAQATAEAEKAAAEAEKAEEAALAQTAAESASDQSPALEKELADATGEAHPGKVCVSPVLTTAKWSCSFQHKCCFAAVSGLRVLGALASAIICLPLYHYAWMMCVQEADGGAAAPALSAKAKRKAAMARAEEKVQNISTVLPDLLLATHTVILSVQ
jgi:hypothetical protein